MFTFLVIGSSESRSGRRKCQGLTGSHRSNRRGCCWGPFCWARAFPRLGTGKRGTSLQLATELCDDTVGVILAAAHGLVANVLVTAAHGLVANVLLLTDRLLWAVTVDWSA